MHYASKKAWKGIILDRITLLYSAIIILCTVPLRPWTGGATTDPIRLYWTLETSLAQEAYFPATWKEFKQEARREGRHQMAPPGVAESLINR